AVTTTSSGGTPVTVGSKTFDTNAAGFTDWYGATVSTASMPTRTGAGALQVTCAAGWCGVLDTTTSPAQPVTAGKQYRVSVWARAAATPANVLLNLEWIDIGGNNLSVSQLRPNATTTTAGWTEIAGPIVAPAGAARARLGLKLDNGSTVGTQYFDDYTLIESTITATQVAAKDFETSVDGFTATNLSSIATTTAQAQTGTRSLQVTPTGGGWNITDTTGVTVTAGAQYQLTGWGRRVGWGTFVVKAEWRNASNTVIATTTIGEPDMGESWKPFATGNLTAPTGATQLRVRFSGWTTDTWYFDNITITAITAPATTTTVLTERRYYQLAGVSIGTRTRDTITNIDVYHYLLGDTRGSTSLALQRGTTTTQTQWYDPYGKPRGTASITATDRGYIGQYEDTTTGLNYLNNRYHDPTLGVFLSVDPLVSVTGEPYIYASGNPTTLSDPTGLDPCPKSGCSWTDSGGRSPCPRNPERGGGLQCTGGGLVNDTSSPRYAAWLKYSAWEQYYEGWGYETMSGRTALRFVANVASFVPFVDIPADSYLCGDSAANGSGADAGWDCGGAAIPAVGVGWLKGRKLFGNLFGHADEAAALLRAVDDVSPTISPQRQLRHLEGTAENAANGGGYLNSLTDAQSVLDALKNGSATVLGRTRNGHLLVRVDEVTGYNTNVAAGFVNQPTNVFIVKGTTSPSVVPTSPTAKPAR
ncbi:MAG: RHS repeat-associated core domain-containing protein, partial [Planctomycetota bacterium]